MIKDFKKFYFIYYKDKDIDTNKYIDLLFSNVEKYKENIMYSDFCFNYLKCMDDSTSLQMLAALKYLNYHYNEVKLKIIDELINNIQQNEIELPVYTKPSNNRNQNIMVSSVYNYQYKKMKLMVDMMIYLTIVEVFKNILINI